MYPNNPPQYLNFKKLQMILSVFSCLFFLLFGCKKEDITETKKITKPILITNINNQYNN